MFDYSFGPGEAPDIIASNLILEIMSRNTSGDKWIIIGHSLGGLVARAVEYEISNNNYGIDLVGIITIGTPHQGAPAANVLANNAQNIVDLWHSDASQGPEVGPSSLVSLSMLILWDAGLISDEAWRTLLMPSYLDSVKAEAEEWIGLAQDTNADELLVPLSSLIQELNSGTTVAPHRSIIGAERSPTIMRWSSEMSTFFQGNYNEIETMEFYNGIIEWYSSNVDAFDFEVGWYEFLCIKLCIPFTDICYENSYCDQRDNSRSKRDKWQLGLAAWQNIDNTWSQAIGCGDVYTYTTQIWHPGYLDCSNQRDINFEIRNGTFDFETLFNVPVGCEWISGWMETNTVVVNVAQKNDGLIQANMARWKSTDDWTPNNPTAMENQGNYYYDDDPSDPTSGWNHSEMMRYTRIYPGTDGTPGANIETPLKDNAEWMLQQLGPGGN